ncbi:MAG: hypothetical protein QM820_43885 [Minicystis sp.]
MFKKILVAFGLSLSVAACVGSPDDSTPPGDSTPAGNEPVASAQQPLPSSGWTKTYYSDATRTVIVGEEYFDCDPDYRGLEGVRSNWYKMYYYDCLGFDNPNYPMTKCFSCKTATDCTLVPC